MNFRAIINVLGALIIFESLSMIFPLLFSLYYHESDTSAFLISMAIGSSIGGFLIFLTRAKNELKIREGFAIVGLGWTVMAAFGALPFTISGAIPSFTNAFFETMSGFTTTGASILTNIETLPHGILFWRSQTHWIGGMGIIVLSLAILPLLGVGGMQLFKAEVPGPVPDKLSPRIKETAKILWGVYMLVTVVETIFLLLGNMSLFDALCHTFGTVATGGFSTKNASVAHYDSLYIEIIIILFMFIAGTNFSLHYKFLTGKLSSYRFDREFLFYFKFVIIMIASVTALVYFFKYQHWGQSLRTASFQVVSIITTTGYATDDFEVWSGAGQLIMLLLMFIGGCAGSTGGSIKIIRIMIVLKQGVAEMKKLLHPNAYIPVRLGGRVVQPEVVTNILGFFPYLYHYFYRRIGVNGCYGIGFYFCIIKCCCDIGKYRTRFRICRSNR